MKLSEQIKPISYLKANAAEVIRNLAQHREPLIITVNGEAKAVLQGIKEYEEMHNAISLIKLLSSRSKQFDNEKHDSLDSVLGRVAADRESGNGV